MYLKLKLENCIFFGIILRIRRYTLHGSMDKSRNKFSDMNWDFDQIKIALKKKKIDLFKQYEIQILSMKFPHKYMFSHFSPPSSLKWSFRNEWKEVDLKLASHANLKGCRGFKSRQKGGGKGDLRSCIEVKTCFLEIEASWKSVDV